MNEDQKKNLIVIRSGDKFLLLPLSFAFSIGFGVAFYVIHQWQPDDDFNRVMKFLGKELSMTLALFSFLVFIRCFISNQWIEGVLTSATRKALVAVLLIACALVSVMFLTTIFK